MLFWLWHWDFFFFTGVGVEYPPVSQLCEVLTTERAVSKTSAATIVIPLFSKHLTKHITSPLWDSVSYKGRARLWSSKPHSTYC